MPNLHFEYNKELLYDKDVLVHHHLGLGDHIVSAGMVNYIAENQANDKKVYLLCKKNNFENVKNIFSKNKKVIVFNIEDTNEYAAALNLCNTFNLEYIRIGHEKYSEAYEKKYGWDCGQVFYYLAKIDYRNRFEKFTYEYNEEKNLNCFNFLNPKNEKYVFVHDDPNRGYNLFPQVNESFKIIKNNNKFSLFDYIDILKKAEEIHVMPSSFYCLIESIPDINAKLYCYNIRGVNFGSYNMHSWNIIR
jgi:hypothetical protein